ncbi:MAG: hypothetical protein ACLP00_22965 [Terracidiphilus sp.]
MRFRILISALLALASAPLVGQATAAPFPSADEVIARMLARDAQRETAAGGYTGNRQYVLDNPGLDKQARMVVSVTCGLDGTKNFQVVSEQGWKSANRRVIRKMLESESEASRPSVRHETRITSDNYAFQLTGAAPLDGRLAYVIDLIPKRQDEYLFRGHIWVDAEDYALARVEGEPARSPSFWIRSVHFTQEYRKSGEYWFPWSTTSISEARIFGRTEVDIHHFDYAPRSGAAGRDTNPQFVEARFVKH